MRAGAGLLLLLLLLSACAAPPWAPWAPSAPSAPLLPQPRRDAYAPGSPQERAYERWIKLGYAAARRGGWSTFCLFGDQVHDPLLVASSVGWEEGCAAGMQVWQDQVDEALRERDRERLLWLVAENGQPPEELVAMLLRRADDAR